MRVEDDVLAQLDELGISFEEAQEICTPVHLGPSWEKDAFGNWVLPEHSLGWHIAGWCAEYLLGPGGTPWKFTLEQFRLLLWWYAVDEAGNFLYQRGVIQRSKGWGKDPFLAAIAIVEFVGPCRFSHWGEDGRPVGKPVEDAWVQIAAVSQSQTVNTMSVFPGMMSKRLLQEYQITPGAVLYRAQWGRRRLEAVTSNPRTLEGGRITFCVLNESHHWIVGNKGKLMKEAIDRNTVKFGGRYVAITNAYEPGEDSVAQDMREDWEAVQEGTAPDSGTLYDSLEANPRASIKGPLVPFVLRGVYGDSYWQYDRIPAMVQSMAQRSVSKATSRRFWFNQVVASEDAIHDAGTWDPNVLPKAHLEPGDEVVMGFDGGLRDDATAIVIIRIRDSCAFLHFLSEKPDGPEAETYEVNRAEVDSAVREAFRLYKVRGFFCDVALWESYIADWAQDFGEIVTVRSSQRNPIAWDMRVSLEQTTRAHERLVRSIFDGKLHHDGDPRLRRHVLNAHRRENNYGVSFGKPGGRRAGSRKVDAYAALMLAHEALVRFKTGRRPQERQRSGRVTMF